MSVNLH